MSGEVDLRVLELLAARLCHELISPVGAINNGVELLDEDDPAFVKEAMGLIGQSARKAGQRLQFYRFAYGQSGGGTSGAAPDARDLAAALLEGGKVRCEWAPEAATLPHGWQRLACNMLVLAAEMLPRGGSISVRALPDGRDGVEVTATGDPVAIAPELKAALAPGAESQALTSRTVHGYFTARLAARLGATLAVAVPDPGRAVLAASAGS